MPRRIVLICLLLVTGVAVLGAVTAQGHPERTTAFPYPATGHVPVYRTTGPRVVVCKPDSGARLAAEYGVKLPKAKKRSRKAHHRTKSHHGTTVHRRARHTRPRAKRKAKAFLPTAYRQRRALLSHCRFHDIQTGINAAHSGYRVMIMPGVYKEQPSRNVPVGSPGKPPCPNNYVTVEGDYRFAPPPVGPASNDPPERADRNYAIHCPNSKNLIAVIGDTRPEPNPAAPILPKCV